MTEDNLVSPPPWFDAKLQQRVALVKDRVPDEMLHLGAILMLFLTEPEDLGYAANAVGYEKWERTCDGCGTLFPSNDEFYNGHADIMSQGVHIVITYGVCQSCKDQFTPRV